MRDSRKLTFELLRNCFSLPSESKNGHACRKNGCPPRVHFQATNVNAISVPSGRIVRRPTSIDTSMQSVDACCTASNNSRKLPVTVDKRVGRTGIKEVKRQAKTTDSAMGCRILDHSYPLCTDPFPPKKNEGRFSFWSGFFEGLSPSPQKKIERRRLKHYLYGFHHCIRLHQFCSCWLLFAYACQLHPVSYVSFFPALRKKWRYVLEQHATNHMPERLHSQCLSAVVALNAP